MRTKTTKITHDSLNVGRKPDYLPTSEWTCNQNRHLVCMSKKRATQPLVSCAYELTLISEDWMVKDTQKALDTKVAARVDQHLKTMGFQP
ncbi:MAG: hypothetical protein PHV02_11740 [Rhodocyclaceae bacterium]|nr:hypothetical protein [Rhodocyclaceae bacterium]